MGVRSVEPELGAIWPALQWVSAERAEATCTGKEGSMLGLYEHAGSRDASKAARPAFLTFVVGLLAALAFACGGEEGVLRSSPTAEVAALTPTPMPSPAPTGSPAAEAEGCLASADRIAYVDEGGDVWFVNRDGTDATQVTQSGNNSELVFSPDGKKVAYVHRVRRTSTGGTILDIRVVLRWDSAFRETVVQEPMPTFVRELGQFVAPDNLRWTIDGTSVLAHIAFGGVSQHYIGAFPVDSAVEPYFLGGLGGEPTTDPMQTLLRVYEFDVQSATGAIAYVMYRNADPYGYYLSVTDRDGSNDRYVLPPSGVEKSYSTPSWSPVSQDIAFCARGPDGTYSVAVVNSEPSTGVATPRELATIGPSKPTERPQWSPDGTLLAYDDGVSVWIVDVAGSSDPRKLAEGTHPSWSPDGSEIAFESQGKVWVVSANDGEPRLVAEGSDPEWSPDASVCERAPALPTSTPTATTGLTASPTDATTPTAMATPTSPPVDARSVPIESLLRPGAKVEKVLYASLDETPQEEIVVYSTMMVMKGEQECGPVPLLDVFAYDADRGEWANVFNGNDGDEPIIPVRLEDYQQGPMCGLIYWIDPLELMDFDGDGRHELLVRTVGGGGSGNPGDVVVIGFEGAGRELNATRLFQARLWKLQAVVVVSDRELWLEQGLWSEAEPGGIDMTASLRGVVRHSSDLRKITVVDQHPWPFCTQGFVSSKTNGILKFRCDFDKWPGSSQAWPAEMEFVVNQETAFEPTLFANSLEDVQLGDLVRVDVAAYGLSNPWVVGPDGVWEVGGGSTSLVAARVEVLGR